jgi:hypothetical protein
MSIQSRSVPPFLLYPPSPLASYVTSSIPFSFLPNNYPAPSPAPPVRQNRRSQPKSVEGVVLTRRSAAPVRIMLREPHNQNARICPTDPPFVPSSLSISTSPSESPHAPAPEPSPARARVLASLPPSAPASASAPAPAAASVSEVAQGSRSHHAIVRLDSTGFECVCACVFVFFFPPIDLSQFIAPSLPFLLSSVL